MLPRRAIASTLLAAALACASASERPDDGARQEGLVEVLPRGAIVEVDGVLLGRGSRTLPIADRRPVHRVVARAPGFEPLEVRVPAPLLAGGRVALVLRPTGFGVGRRLDMDEPDGLAAAAALLLRQGRADDAVEYAARAAAVAPSDPATHRLLGDALDAAGRRDRAVREYERWLAMVPKDEPGRAEVERRVAASRGDIAVPEGR